MDSLTIVLIGVAFGLGALIGWLAARPQSARLQAALEREHAAHEEQLRTWNRAEASFREAFSSLSAQALNQNNEAFLQLAETRLRQARSEASADVEARKKAIEDLLAPMAQTLERVDAEVRDSERRRLKESSELLQRVATLDGSSQNLQAETRRLVDALKRPGVRGRWGELQLKRVVELAGMINHCDFTEQQTLSGTDRRIRPDVIIQLPGGKTVIIDAKVPLDAYLRALEAPDDAARQALLIDHARQVRTHLSQLGAKNYFADVTGSPEFVVMFLPGEMFFSAALEQDPTLIEYGVERQVIPASPTTLIALLRAVAYGWQQEAMEENARQISELGRNLYESVRALARHFSDLGSRLNSSLDAYNKAVGSLEGNVLVKARRFKELQAAPNAEEIEHLEPIDRVPRALQAPELTDGLPFTDDEEVEHV
ncbi:MAG TPA: DNA recombination protein RmuC [Vicinamibacterales bacterium]|nr:DNA recombination protein RmuC [Vicinamibacterales bacterium]